ncbi:MAG: P44/Msp2 family outer membrane protein [Wolbachia endosymbiont of Menacanthus eurysternus]|nr:MAG: P44/Msp2 family outer membrane protein [Wolbachia endosymbiont of Menacanthus eurysternus]
MHYKKFFSSTALVALLSLSNAAFSDSIDSIIDEEANYYIRMQYNNEFLPFKTEVRGVELKKEESQRDYLKASFIAGSTAFGYKMDDIRVDIEGLYSQLYKSEINDDTMSVSKITDNLTVFSGLINVYYDIEIEDIPVTPYVGVGLGIAYLNNPMMDGVITDQKYGFGFAYQAKAGVSYDTTPEVKLFAGARYFGSYGAKFDKSEDEKGIKIIKDAYRILYNTVGAETGIIFNF